MLLPITTYVDPHLNDDGRSNEALIDEVSGPLIFLGFFALCVEGMRDA